jgi:hypothetical protein
MRGAFVPQREDVTGGHVVENQVGGTCGSCGKNRNDTSCCDKDLKGKVYVVDLETHGNIKMELQEAGWEDAA